MVVTSVACFFYEYLLHYENVIYCSSESVCVLMHRNDELQDALGRVLPHLEIYNRKLTNKYGLWAVGFCAGVFSANHPGHLFAEDQALEDVTSLDLSERDMQTFSPHVGCC